MSQQQSLKFVVEIIQDPFTIQIICLLGQFIVTIRSTHLLIKNKDKYPIKQNTNILTILILFSFLICNTILLITRIIIQSNFSQDQPSFFEQTCCFWHIKPVQYLSYVHLFFSEMLIPSIAFKMFRVSIAYYPKLQKEWIINIMKSRKAIVIGVCIWAGVFTLIQVILNNTYLPNNHQYDQQMYGGIQLYQFFCAKYPSNLPGQLWLVQFSKTTLTLIIYIIQYYFAGIIPQTYNFKWQYNSQFIIFMLPILARNILDMTYTSNLLIWYHTQFFMYYLSTITIAWYHRQTKQLPKNNNPAVKSLKQIKNGKFDQAMHLFQNPQFVKVFRLYLKKYHRQSICEFIQMFYNKIIQLKGIQQRQSLIQSQLEYSRYKQKIQQLKELKSNQVQLYTYLKQFQEKDLKIFRKNKFYNLKQSLMKEFKNKIQQLKKIYLEFTRNTQKILQNIQNSSQERISQYLQDSTFLTRAQIQLNTIFKDYHEKFLQQELKMFTKDSMFINYMYNVQNINQKLGDILGRLKIQLKK